MSKKKNIIKNTILACTVAGMVMVGGTAAEVAEASSAGNTISSTAVSKLSYSRSLTYGATGNDVLELQRALKQLGYYSYNVGGGFGPGMKASVLSFQRAKGISVDGSAGPETIRTINSALNGEGSGVSQLSYNRALRYGANGNDVLDLQKALKQLGHYKHNIGGGFGPAMKQAVLDFQSAQGISVDGIAGAGTIKTINGVLSGKIKAGSAEAPSRGNASRSVGLKLANEAKKHLGTRYVFGGTSTSGFDCSGFTSYVYSKAGISIPRTTGSQASVGSKVSKSNLKVGDLIIFSNTYKRGPSHAGVYLGNGKFVHASSSGRGVTIDSINSSYYSSKFSYGRRVF